MSSSQFFTTTMTGTSTVTTTANNGSGTTIGGTGGGNDGGGVSTTSSSLYLFTFLGTLLLLLAVSCAIVARSFVLRRRFRRRMEEAIAAGLVLPQLGDKRRNLGEKPKIFETWLAPGKETWQDIMPVSLRNIPRSKRPRLAQSTPRMNNHEEEEEPNTFFGRARNYMSFGGPFHHSRSGSRPAASPFSPTAEDDLADGRVQVTVMIAMPTPGQSHYPLSSDSSTPIVKGKAHSPSEEGEWEDEELPVVLMGVTELSYPSIKQTTASTTASEIPPQVAGDP